MSLAPLVVDGAYGLTITHLSSSVSSGDPDVIRSDGTGTGRSSDLVGEDLLTDLLEVTVGEDETNVATDERQKTLVLGGVVDEDLKSTANL